MNKPICKNCADRQLGCHDACEKFKEFKEENERIRAERNKIRDFYAYVKERKPSYPRRKDREKVN